MILFGALTGSTISQLGAALAGTFDDHHALLCRQIIAHIDFCDQTIAELTQEIIEGLGDFGPANAILCSIPGVSDTTAQAIIAETQGFQLLAICARSQGSHQRVMSQLASEGQRAHVTVPHG